MGHAINNLYRTIIIGPYNMYVSVEDIDTIIN